MYITVPMRKNQHRKAQRKHQQSIFKQIQYNNMFQKLHMQDQIKKSNGFVTFKQKILKQKQNLPLRKSCTTLQRSSFALPRPSLQANKSKIHRPSVASIISTSGSKKNQFIKSTFQLYNRNWNQAGEKDLVIEERPAEQRQSQDLTIEKQQHNDVIKNYLGNIRQIKQTINLEKVQRIHTKVNKRQKNKIQSSSTTPLTSSFHQPSKPLKKRLFRHRKNVTLLDLQVQNIQQIMKKSGRISRSIDNDFKYQVKKDQTRTVQHGWKSFYNEVGKCYTSKNTNIQGKISKIRRTATSHHNRKQLVVQNEIESILLQKKNTKSKFLQQNKRDFNYQIQRQSFMNQNCQLNKKLVQNQSEYNIQLRKSQGYGQTRNSCLLESQSMNDFFTFVKGGQKTDQYSNGINLNHYKKCLLDFYILKNIQQQIKQTNQYKKISIQNFKNYPSDKILSFVYVNQNQYKLRDRRNV